MNGEKAAVSRPRAARDEVVEHVPQPPRPPWYRDVWPWLLVLGLVVLGGIGAWVGWQSYGDDESGESPQAVTTTGTTVVTKTTTVEEELQPVDVPDVVGLHHVEGGRTIEADGLAADSYPVPSDDDPGAVVSQNPDGGTQLNEGQIVRLNVSQGRGTPETRELPDVTGPQASDARATARRAGFTVRTVPRDAPTEEEIGEVLTQQPAPGTSAPEFTQITIFVGR